ncbi:MAG: polysaccharide deacetylase family protein [bacterium]|nr:polysaccharide deacetylase family protein [Candidatus Margulisiibacteriota bacterium]
MKLKSLCLVFFLIFFVSPAFAKTISHGRHPKHIALTFDDGPNAYVTAEILNVLKRENVPATFFVVGKKLNETAFLLRRMVAEGHEIGNHTYSHSPITWLNDQKLTNELKRTSNLITKHAGRRVNLFRPPHGRNSSKKQKIVEQRGYDTVLWTVNADDFYHRKTGMRSPQSIAKRVVSRVYGGDIILMHDNSQQIIEALPLIIRNLKKRGFYFVTVSKMVD